MLLGIGLHTALGFLPGLWPVQDAGASWDAWFDEFFFFIHGFRMPLFFLLSGFFTAMLWRRGGLRSLLKHRARRIGLPLAIGLFTVLPAVMFSILAGYTLAEEGARAGLDTAATQTGTVAPTAWPDADSEGAGDVEEKADEPFGFAHMWFLWQLLWMVAGFAVVVLAVRGLARLRGRTLPARTAAIVLWALPVLTLLPQLVMGQGGERSFGPDTDGSLLPTLHILAYYGTFFAFGAMGLFQRILADERYWVRFMSDASYWMYLAHLPLIFLAQGVVANWAASAGVKFIVICGTVSALLIISYRYLVRYTFIGCLLNGPRTPAGDAAIRARAESSRRPAVGPS